MVSLDKLIITDNGSRSLDPPAVDQVLQSNQVQFKHLLFLLETINWDPLLLFPNGEVSVVDSNVRR